MRRLLLLISAAMCLPACPNERVVLREPVAFRPQRAPAAPKFVVLPAVDQRPTWEKSGDKTGVTLRIAGPGAAMFWHAGANVIPDKNVVWGRNRFSGWSRSARTMVSSDLGQVLTRSTQRPVQYWGASLRTQRQVAAAVTQMRLPEGTVVVLPVLDHLTRVKAKTKQASASQTKQYTSTHVITTTRSSRASQSVGAVWTVMMRLHVFEVRGGRVTRHVVRYAAASGARPNTYAAALGLAARQVVGVAALLFRMPTQPRPAPSPGMTAPGTGHPGTTPDTRPATPIPMPR